MRDQLKNYIDDHRAELNKAVPSDKLWSNIETAMIVAIPAAGISSSIPWLKYFAFGLTTVAGAAIIYVAATNSAASAEQATIAPSAIQNVPPVATEQIASATVTPTGFIVMNTSILTPPPNEDPLAGESGLVFPVKDSLPAQPIQPLASVTISAADTLFAGIKRVEVVSSSALITVKGSTGNNVEVTPSNPIDSSVRLEYKRVDTTLQITLTVQCKEKVTKLRKNFKVVECNTANPELTVSVPSGTSIVVQNSYGDTKVSGINAPVCEVRSSSGDVKIASIIATTTVATSYGDLDAQNITGNMNARLSSGDVKIEHVNGDVDVVSTYGDQAFTDISGNLKTSGSSGNINIAKLRGDVNANTTYGYIQITDFKGSARLTSSSGSILGDAIELTANSTFVTTYGDVNMTLINPLQDLSFELATTYGDILIDKNGEVLRNENKLNLTRGKILVKATSSSGDQVFR